MHSERAIELAADSLARLDLTCSTSSPSATLALEIAVAAQLLGLTSEERLQLIAAQSEGSTSPLLTPDLLTGWTGLQELQRRARSGARLSLAMTRSLLDREELPSIEREDAASIDAILHDQASSRSALSEAAELTARAPGTLGQLLAALHLVSRGRTDRLRLLPPDPSRITGHPDPERFLIQLAADARALTGRLRKLSELHAEIESQLDGLGRAAITARAVLAELRVSLALSAPQLADTLELSRPAIHDACDRLLELRLIRECTGRARGRVYADESMLAFALPADPQ